MKKKLFSFLLLISYFMTPRGIFAWDGDAGPDGDVATFDSLPSLFSNLLTNVLSLIGIATFVMIIVGGFKYLTSGGDPKAAEAAKGTITYGILGLVLTVAAWFILLAISKFTGNEALLKFQLNSTQ